MASISIKLNEKDVKELYRKAGLIQKGLTAKSGFVYKYILTLGNGYTTAVISGMGNTVSGSMTLKSFLGESVSVKWEPNTLKTIKLKTEMNWDLQVWKASGETETATKDSFRISNTSTGIDMFAGIDGTKFAEAFEHAYRTEYGVAERTEGNNPFNGRALFTVLNILLAEKADIITAAIAEAIRKEIAKAKWGS